MACRNCARHEIERRADKALGARFRLTVPNFSDCPAGAVRNSYPKPSLLWDNVIAGPWGWPRSTVLAQVPARHPPCDGSGRLRYAKRVNFQLRNATRRGHGSVRDDAP
jgi:hypothetical protein